MAAPHLGVFTTGPWQELVVAEAMIKSGSPLVMDILTITTLSSLNALDDVLLLQNERIVTHSTLEELYDLIREQEASSKTGTFTVGVVNGQFVKQVLSPDDVQSQIKLLEGLANWIKSHCTVVPSSAALKMNALEKAKLDGLVGKSFLDSILTAKERKALLYAEEMPVRAYAYADYQVKGCATFFIYRFLKEQKLITTEHYNEKIMRLMVMNYKTIPSDGDLLYFAAVQSKFTTGFPMNLALSGLNAPLMPAGLEITAAVRFFYKLFTEKINVILSADNTDHIRTLINATLAELSVDRIPDKLEDTLLRVSTRLFQFIPVQHQELRKIIAAYFHP